VSTTPPHPEAPPDRPGAVTVPRIVARNSGHPEPYTGTRTVLVCSSRPRGPAAAAGGRTPPRTPPLRWGGGQGTRNGPDNFGPAAGGFTQALGGWAGPKLERVEFPAFGVRCTPMLGRSYWPMLAMLSLPYAGYAGLNKRVEYQQTRVLTGYRGAHPPGRSASPFPQSDNPPPETPHGRP